MSDDEFNSYDFSEFTDEDFAQIDAYTASKFETIRELPETSESQSSISTTVESDSQLSFGAGGPAVTIEFDESANSHVTKARTDVRDRQHNDATSRNKRVDIGRSYSSADAKLSPFELFRKWKILSVTDLVSPLWCEVQFDYGLRQMRYKRLDQRPSSFVTSTGKQIVVEPKIAAANERTLKRGRSVHKELEKEVHPEEIRVTISSDEERWALRLHNLTSGLTEIVESGRTRELPVFGIIHGQVVTGVIDEVFKHDVSHREATTNKSHRSEDPISSDNSEYQRHMPSPPRSQITTFSHSSASPPPGDESEAYRSDRSGHTLPLNSHSEVPQSCLRILDTKTRKTQTLPPEKDTMVSRLQLMLYHRLLSSLLSPLSLNFDDLWARLDIDPTRQLSAQFVRDIGLTNGNPTLQFLVEQWWNVVHWARASKFGLQGVDLELQLVYRTQSTTRNAAQMKGKRGKSVFANLREKEERDIALAIEKSLRDLGDNEDMVSDTATIITEGVKRSAEDATSCGKDAALGILTGSKDAPLPGILENDPELAWALQESLLVYASQVASGAQKEQDHTDTSAGDSAATAEKSQSDSSISRAETVSEMSTIIGTKEFVMDDVWLDEHLFDVLQWWHGRRPPRGVSISDSQRCFTCEYCSGCEWREKKAAEIARPANRGVEPLNP